MQDTHTGTVGVPVDEASISNGTVSVLSLRDQLDDLTDVQRVRLMDQLNARPARKAAERDTQEETNRHQP